MNNQQNQQQLAEFVQWLPQNIAQFQGQIPDEVIAPIANAKTPEEVVGVLNQLSQSEQGNQLVAGMFQAYQQSKQQGMFKKGGKLDQLLKKFQIGGKTSLNKSSFYRIISAPGDTLDTKPYRYRTDTRHTFPDGSVIMQTITNSDTNNYYDPRRGALSFLRKLWYGFPQAAPEEVLQNWDELEKNHKNETNVLDKTKKK